MSKSATTEGARPRKKLIEVGLPLEAINREAAREKSIRHGHPSTLHLWWARRPLAAARAVLFAQLVDDPSFRPDLYPTEEEQIRERKRLHRLIERLVPWEATFNKALLREAQEEIIKSCDGNLPPVLDPFAGGGTIPLEAQRLGLNAYASDLNPVPVLINKAILELPTKFNGQPPVYPGASASRIQWENATGLAEDVRHYARWIREEAHRRIGKLYPSATLEDGTKLPVITWIWARTVACPNPACRADMPLVKSFWLGKKKGKERYVNPVVTGKKIRFEIAGPKGQPQDGTVDRSGAVCLVCNMQVPLSYIRDQGCAGQIGAQLMAIVAEGDRRRHYLEPNADHENAATVARPIDVPDTELPEHALGFRVQAYGMTRHSDLFSARQLTTVTTLSDLVEEARQLALSHGAAEDRAAAISTYLAFAINKVADNLSNLCRWRPDAGKEGMNNLFSRQAISMVWDFAEGNPFTLGPCEIDTAADWIAKAIDCLPQASLGKVTQEDAATRDYSGFVISTDPPYYDNVPYADLADFFYIWLRRSLKDTWPKITSTMLTPKDRELVAEPFRHGGKQAATDFFEQGFRQVFAAMAPAIRRDFPITVYYAFKQAESTDGSIASTGWETLLEGMIRAGFEVTATWPMRTELGNRMRSIESNALATSIVLACRVREDSAGSIDRRTFIMLLRSELPDALRHLQQSAVAPVDLAQSAIGPGVAVFTRYNKVTEPDGSAMRVRTALALINEVLAEVLAEQEGDFDADTRWCVKWFEQHQWDEGSFGDAETLAKAYNTSVRGLEDAGVVRARAGKAVLISPDKVLQGYDPGTDPRITVWEVTLQVSQLLEQQGVEQAGAMLAMARSKVSPDAVKELSYLLYSIAERKKWSESALRFNKLASSWSDILDWARKATNTGIVSELEYEES